MDFSDYNQITRRRYEYALGIDTRDFDLLRSIFTPSITMDFEDYSGHPAEVLQADDWVANCRVLFTGLDATQHVMTNPIVDIENDRATCKMSMKAEHFLHNDPGNVDFALGGYYIDQLEKDIAHLEWERPYQYIYWKGRFLDLCAYVLHKMIQAWEWVKLQFLKWREKRRTDPLY